MSWNDFFFMNSKFILHIYNQLKNTCCTPPLEDVFGIFKYVQLKDIKVVMIGDKPYKSSRDITDIAFGTKNANPPEVLKRIYENLEKTVISFKRPFNNHLDRWLHNGIFLCNFCFTRPIADPLPYHYDLLGEPFINNLVQYISNDHPVVFMLFGSKALTVRKSINEIKSSVVEVPHPIYEYNEFKKSKCFCKARELACDLGFTIQW